MSSSQSRPVGRENAPSATLWRSIESAPKDGTEFLCFWRPLYGEPEIVRARWNSDVPWIGFYGLNVTGLDGRGTISDLSGGWPEKKLLATHWMPLPEEPQCP